MSVMHSPSTSRRDPGDNLDPPLSDPECAALQQACAPAGRLCFPPAPIIRVLRMLGYIEIVLGGVQITPKGLERLLRERKRKQEHTMANLR